MSKSLTMLISDDAREAPDTSVRTLHHALLQTENSSRKLLCSPAAGLLKAAAETFGSSQRPVSASHSHCGVLTGVKKAINYMVAHLQTHRKDKHSRRGLQGMLNKRRKLLKYLRRKDFTVYKTTITELQLRDNYF